MNRASFGVIEGGRDSGRPAERKTIIDDYAELSATIDWKSVRRCEGLASTIRGWYADADPEASFTETGERYQVEIGPRGNQRHITSMRSVFTMLGKDVFLRHCGVAMKVLEELFSGNEIASVTEWRQTGPRKLQVSATDRLKKAA